jgi:hypothetical protein
MVGWCYGVGMGGVWVGIRCASLIIIITIVAGGRSPALWVITTRAILFTV